MVELFEYDLTGLETGLEMEKFISCVPDEEFTVQEMTDICILNKIYPNINEQTLKLRVIKTIKFLVSVFDLIEIKRSARKRGRQPISYLKNRS